ncbi:MAG: NINE protein [Nocardioides sp.]
MTQPPYPSGDPEQPSNYGQQPPPPPPYGQSSYPPYGGAPGGHPVSGMPAGPYFIAVMGQEQGPIELGQLAQMAISGTVRPDTMVRAASGQSWFAAKEVPGLYSDKEMVTTAIISWLVGVFGVDRFYLGYTGLGLLKLFTCGGLGIWALIDLILIILRKVPDSNGRPLR